VRKSRLEGRFEAMMVDMKVIVFGATGMVGQGVLRECLADPDVEKVLAVGRHPTGRQDEKLRDLVHEDFTDFSAIEGELAGYDACFFCLGVSSVGMSEEDYRRVTYDFSLAAAETLARLNPGMTFNYVSGAHTDSTEQGRSMWARVKGETENALMKLPFKAAFMFRPGYIQPMHGVTSKTKLYRSFYALAAPLYPVFKTLFPSNVTTTEKVGRAMLEIAKHGWPERILENKDINRAATK
jgi:uncharacterized protein YbjT (DUF2867 family)